MLVLSWNYASLIDVSFTLGMLETWKNLFMCSQCVICGQCPFSSREYGKGFLFTFAQYQNKYQFEFCSPIYSKLHQMDIYTTLEKFGVIKVYF